MTWHTTLYRLPVGDWQSCQSPGCGDQAQFHAATGNGSEHRTLLQCELCAETLATRTGLRLPNKPAGTFPIPDGHTPSACRSCGESIHWIRHSKTLRTMPINTDGTSHHLSCPYASRHRSA